MPWTLRHQGSSHAVEHLTGAQVVAGLRDGVWDATDGVLGPGETHWSALENHERFADVVTDLEEAAATTTTEDPEAQRIDMNPLIDVCLVLLVFFILATTIQVLERVLDLPTSRDATPGMLPHVSRDTVLSQMILVEVRKGHAGVLFRINDEEVPAANLEASLERVVRLTRREEVVIDARDVAWGTVVKVLDAAAGAKVRKVHFRADVEETR